MEPHSGTLRALTVLGVTLLLASGCSVANPFAPSNASAKQNAQEMALEWAQCMRQHGIKASDPDANGGVSIQAPVGATPPSSSGGSASVSGNGDAKANGNGPPPEVQAAMDSCKQYQPKGGQGSGQPSQQQIDAATKFAKCMRDHGIPMNDPSGSAGSGTAVANPGAVDPNSDQFKQAKQACQHFLPNNGQGMGTQTGTASG
jgi:hypothetical protein